MADCKADSDNGFVGELAIAGEKTVFESNDTAKEASPKDSFEVDLAGLSDEHRAAILSQVYSPVTKRIRYFDLYRYATWLEIFLMCIGVLGACVAGAAQPLMTVIFGKLTGLFATFGAAVARGETKGPAFEALQKELRDQSAKDTIFFLYLFAAIFVGTYLFMGVFTQTSERISRRVRENYLRSVLRQNIGYFEKLGSGQVVNRIETDAHLVQTAIGEKVPIAAQYIATFIAGFVIAFVEHWKLALVVSSIIPGIILAGVILNHYESKYIAMTLDYYGQASSLAEEVISTIRTAQAFGAEEKLSDRYKIYLERARIVGAKKSLALATCVGAMFFVIYSGYSLAFYFGTTLLLALEIDVAKVITVFFSILTGAFSLSNLPPCTQAMAIGVGAAAKIYETIDRKPIIDSLSPEGKKPDTVRGDFVFEHVDFIYPSRPKVQILFDYSLHIEAGKTTALVGGSGSGKSTIIGLVERFYDPVAGNVYFDGHNIKDLNVKWLRSNIRLVGQEPTLFATTVYDNIVHGLTGTKYENLSDQEKRQLVIKAATDANAHGFIETLPNGYDTHVGERGGVLSGGQKQRIAIARAIVSDPKVLLLDEATSALDTQSEGIVQEALDRASQGRTTIVIAHRLSTIKNADNIVVLSRGRILEQGNHNSLLANPDGPYSRLVNAQTISQGVGEKTRKDDNNGDSADPALTTRVAMQTTGYKTDRTEKPAAPVRPKLVRSGASSLSAKLATIRDIEKDLEYGFWELVSRLTSMNRKYWIWAILGLVGAIIQGMIFPVYAILYGGVLEALQFSPVDQREKLRSSGNEWALYFFILAIVATIGVGMSQGLLSFQAEGLAVQIRFRSFKSILHQDVAFFDDQKNSSGLLTARLSKNATDVNGLAAQTLGTLIAAIVTLIAGVVIALSYGWKLGLICTATVPLLLSLGFTRLYFVELRDARVKEQHAQSAAVACEAASAIKTVASLTREEECCRIYSESLEGPARVSSRAAWWGVFWFSASQSVNMLVLALGFYVGSRYIADLEYTSKQFFIVFTAIVFGALMTATMFSYAPDMSKAKGGAKSALQLVDRQPAIDSRSPDGMVVAQLEGHVQFEDVHFRYPTRPHVPVLRGLTLDIKPGTYCALVGGSGCGKSTTIGLIEQFYRPLMGRVLIDGHDVSELNLASTRRQIALVAQEPTLYAGTIRFNILLGAVGEEDKVTEEDIVEACKDANIWDFINQLPDGLETEVGGKGASLSGGQKQRIAIARALIRKPKILLLDEATSALDSESEKVVQKALDQAAKGRTTLAVAHRLSTIQKADIIFVFKEGVVAEYGTHEELLANKGLYFDLVTMQSLEGGH